MSPTRRTCTTRPSAVHCTRWPASDKRFSVDSAGGKGDLSRAGPVARRTRHRHSSAAIRVTSNSNVSTWIFYTIQMKECSIHFWTCWHRRLALVCTACECFASLVRSQLTRIGEVTFGAHWPPRTNGGVTDILIASFALQILCMQRFVCTPHRPPRGGLIGMHLQQQPRQTHFFRCECRFGQFCRGAHAICAIELFRRR